MKHFMGVKKEIDPKVDGGSHYDRKASQPLSLEAILAAPSMVLAKDAIPKTLDVPTGGWKPFPSRNIPKNFNYGNVYSFLVEDLANIIINGDGSSDEEVETGDCSTEKPLRKGRMLLKSGFLHNVQDNSDPSFYYLSGTQ